jgi:DnaJ family protein C protein 3
MVKQDSKAYMGFYRRALAYLSIGKAGQALMDFDAALRLQPNLDQVYVQRGQLLMKQGWFEKAKEDFERVYYQTNEASLADKLRELKDVMKRVNMARNFMKNGKYKEAIDIWDEILQTAPSGIQPRLERAECFMKLQEYEQAIGDLR